MPRKPIPLAGLLLSIFGYLLVLATTSLSPISNTLSEQKLTIIGLILIWLLVAVLLVIVRKGEKRTFSSIGFKSITGRDILLAIVIGAALSLTVPLFTLLASQIFPSNGGDIHEVVSSTSWWMIFVSVLTAGITEEIIFRGYIIERINEITKKKWTAVLVSLIAFILPHTMSWNMTHVIAVVLPLGLILSGLYLWKRNLLFNMIIHVVIDLPLVVMALIVK
ncbi:MAG: type II CAAX endopeptidase family protein [Chloroflexota bacterium]